MWRSDESQRSGRICCALMVLLPVALALMVLGCDDSLTIDDPPSPPPPPVYPPPTTPEILMTNFRRAYDEANSQEYGKTLHGDYIFIPLPEDLAELGLVPGQHVEQALEMDITAQIFSGAAGRTGAPGIQDIDVVLFELETAWGPSTDPLFPAPAMEALYRVEIHFQHADGYFLVKGQEKFWVLDVPDAERSHYYLLGQRDFTTTAPKAQDDTWGGVKGMYRPLGRQEGLARD